MVECSLSTKWLWVRVHLLSQLNYLCITYVSGGKNGNTFPRNFCNVNITLSTYIEMLRICT